MPLRRRRPAIGGPGLPRGVTPSLKCARGDLLQCRQAISTSTQWKKSTRGKVGRNGFAFLVDIVAA